MPQDTLCVGGTASVGTEEVYVLVLEADEIPDLDNHSYETVDTGTSLNFAVEVAYGGDNDDPPEFGDYKVVAYPVVGGTPGTPATVPFQRWRQTRTVTVNATQCLWYALADDTDEGPYEEEIPVQNNKPEMEKIPVNVASVSFSAIGSWRHFATDPGTESGPDGRSTVTVGLENEAYRDYGLGNISVPDTNVNKLLGLWKDSGSYEFLEIGSSLDDETVPDDALVDGWLYLGMHDGKRWFNNSESVEVTIVWTVQDCLTTVLERIKRLSKKKNQKKKLTKKYSKTKKTKSKKTK